MGAQPTGTKSTRKYIDYDTLCEIFVSPCKDTDRKKNDGTSLLLNRDQFDREGGKFIDQDGDIIVVVTILRVDEKHQSSVQKLLNKK